MRNNDVRRIVLTALFIAIVTTMTYIGVPWPFSAGGYMHLGTLTSLIIALAYGKRYGALSGGIGMFIFDLFSPYAVWAAGTLIVRFIVGYVVGSIAHNKRTGEQGTNIYMNIIAIIVGAMVMIVGYYLYEAVFLTTYKAALASITGNVIQFTLGLFALVLVPILKKLEKEW